MQKRNYRMWYGSSVVGQGEESIWGAEILIGEGVEEGKYPAFSEYCWAAEFDPKMPEKVEGWQSMKDLSCQAEN